MGYILVAILVILHKEIDGDEEAPQNWVIEASVHLGPADTEDHILNIGVQRGIVCRVGFESVGICRMHC